MEFKYIIAQTAFLSVYANENIPMGRKHIAT